MHLTDSDNDMKAPSALRSVHSNKQAGPLCQRPDYKSAANALVSLQRAQGKGVPHIPKKLRTRQHDTLDPAVHQHLEWLSFNWPTYFSSSSSSTWTESPTWWSSSSWTINGKTGTLKGGKTKNGGISDNNDNARIFKLYWYKETRTEKSERQSLSYCQVHLNPASILSLAHFSDFLAVERPESGNFHERDERCTQNTSPYAHTRTFSRCARSHARCGRTFGSRAWRFVCVCQKSFHHWSCLC